MTERRDGAPDEPGLTDAEPEADVELPTDTEPELVPQTADEPDFAGPEADTDETIVDATPAAAAAPIVAPADRRPMRPAERRAARGKAAAPAPTPSEQAVHIEDRASKAFVLIAIGVFVLIAL
ncbi:MAG TPA: hypothetical protein VM344_05820, partial [Vitreimonas sp.]|nr:hypothetical protein [Vitreimonas sp.]